MKSKFVVIAVVVLFLVLFSVMMMLLFPPLAHAEPAGIAPFQDGTRVIVFDDSEHCRLPGVIGMKYRATWQDPPTPEGAGKLYEGCFRSQYVLGPDGRPLLDEEGEKIPFFVLRFDDGSTVVWPAAIFRTYRDEAI